MSRCTIFFLSFLVSFFAQAAPVATNNLPVKKVLLVVAMDSEAQPIISALNLHKIENAFPNLPMQGYSGQYEKIDILLILNGLDPINKVENVGTQAATLSTYLGIERFHPDLIISIGTAGGVVKNATQLKDIFYSQKIYFYDRRMAFPGYHEYLLGGYAGAIFPSLEKIGLKPGIVCSGDSFDDNKTDYYMFIKENCSAIDMEAAGVAWVSMLTKTPIIAIKGITNFVRGKDIHEQYRKNLPDITLQLATTLQKFLHNLSMKT